MGGLKCQTSTLNWCRINNAIKSARHASMSTRKDVMPVVTQIFQSYGIVKLHIWDPEKNSKECLQPHGSEYESNAERRGSWRCLKTLGAAKVH